MRSSRCGQGWLHLANNQPTQRANLCRGCAALPVGRKIGVVHVALGRGVRPAQHARRLVVRSWHTEPVFPAGHGVQCRQLHVGALRRARLSAVSMLAACPAASSSSMPTACPAHPSALVVGRAHRVALPCGGVGALAGIQDAHLQMAERRRAKSVLCSRVLGRIDQGDGSCPALRIRTSSRWR